MAWKKGLHFLWFSNGCDSRFRAPVYINKGGSDVGLIWIVVSLLQLLSRFMKSPMLKRWSIVKEVFFLGNFLKLNILKGFAIRLKKGVYRFNWSFPIALVIHSHDWSGERISKGGRKSIRSNGFRDHIKTKVSLICFFLMQNKKNKIKGNMRKRSYLQIKVY